MNDSMPEQKIRALTPAEYDRLLDQLAVPEQYLGDDASKEKYKTAAGKLGTIRAILQAVEADLFKSNAYELQCLGAALGDAFVQELHMEWVVIEDEHGIDFAVLMPGTSIMLFPLTMISKRIERGEQVDVFDMFNSIAAQIEELKANGTC
jgi:hypothetical protein